METEMGNRGSKSGFRTEPVKEQRVDGSYLRSIIGPKLRCTLMGGESRYQVKIPSNHLNIQNNYYSSSVCLSKATPLDPFFVTGFTDAEGCFIILILKDPNNKNKWTVKTRFTIGLHRKDRQILELIKTYFGEVGTISSQDKESVQYRVGSLKEINEKIIPHFNKYPLLA